MTPTPKPSTMTLKSGLAARLLLQAPAKSVQVGTTVRITYETDTRQVPIREVQRAAVKTGLLGQNVSLNLHSGKFIPLANAVKAELAHRFVACVDQWIAHDRSIRIAQLTENPARIRDGLKLYRDLFNRAHFLSRWDVQRALDAQPEQDRTFFMGLPIREGDIPDPLGSQIQELLGYHNDLPDYVDRHNEAAVQRLLSECKSLFDEIESNPLTSAQRLAVVRNEDRNLVVAGAGTGKTSTVVARVAYLLRSGLARPDQILLLAFARKAKEEIEERIQQRVGMELDVKTFHSLGLEVLGRAMTRRPSLSKAAEDPAQLIKLIGQYLDDLLGDAVFRKNLFRFFTFYLDPEPLDYEVVDRGTSFRTLKGERVKSQQEVFIANWLFQHGIDYEYEMAYQEADTADEQHARYKPDFFLTESQIYLEHFGVGRDGKTAKGIDAAAYRSDMVWKRGLHAEHGTQLIETYSYQFQEQTIEQDLAGLMERHQVAMRPLSRDDVAALLEKNPYYSPFIGLMANFLKLYKSSGKTLEAVRETASSMPYAIRNKVFLRLFEQVFESYEADLQAANEIDFEDMVVQAAAYTRSGTYSSPYTHIIVDEFQDISAARADLVRALLDQVPGSRLFAVGDDWQSIYRFTGSDISLMTHFEENFGTTCRTDLDTTFRYAAPLLEASSKFISQNPNQLQKQLKAWPQRPGKPIRIRWSEGNEPDQGLIEEVFHQIAEDAAGDEATVIILARYRFALIDLPASIKRAHPNLTVDRRTVHAAKGLEADYVVVCGVGAGRYGFPTEIADDPVLNLVLQHPGDYPHSEERRLFYVALTRAKRQVYLLAPMHGRSYFVNELVESRYQAWVDAAELEYEPASCPELGCDAELVRRDGKFGVFWACSESPKTHCKGVKCSSCDGVMIPSPGGFICNKRGCGETATPCPKCGRAPLVKRDGKNGPFWGCGRYRKCKQENG